MRIFLGLVIAVILLLQCVAGATNVSLTFDPSLNPTKGGIQFEGYIPEYQRKFFAYTTQPGKKEYKFKTIGYLTYGAVASLSGNYSFSGYIGDDYIDVKFKNPMMPRQILLVNNGHSQDREAVKGYVQFGQ